MTNWDISRVFFYILFAGRISEAAMGGAGVGGYYMINMTITELCTALSRFFSKIEISAGFSLYNINFAERDSEAAIAGGRGKIIVLD